MDILLMFFLSVISGFVQLVVIGKVDIVHFYHFFIARKVLLNPSMSFVTINTDTYEQLVFELRRIGNNINQIARAINQSHLISQEQLQDLSKGVGELIKEMDREFQVEVKRLKEFYGSH